MITKFIYGLTKVISCINLTLGNTDSAHAHRLINEKLGSTGIA